MRLGRVLNVSPAVLRNRKERFFMDNSRIIRDDQRTGGQRGDNSFPARRGSSSVRPSMAQHGLGYLRSNQRSNQRSNPQHLRRPQVMTETFMADKDQTVRPEASEQRKKDVEDVVEALWNQFGGPLKYKNFKDTLKYKTYFKKHLLELDEKNTRDPRERSEMYAIGKLILDSLITYDDLNDNQKKGVVSYVGAAFDNINTYERSKGAKAVKDQKANSQNQYRSRLTGQEKSLSAGVEGMCNNAPQTMSDITVYRGFRSAVINGKLTDTSQASANSALSWKDKYIDEQAYLSTSANRSTAEGHCAQGGSLLEIRVPGGWKATYVTLRHEMRESYDDNLRKEYEILFGKGQHIKIENVFLPGELDNSNYYILKGVLELPKKKLDSFEKEEQPIGEEGHPFEEEVNPFQGNNLFEPDDFSF